MTKKSFFTNLSKLVVLQTKSNKKHENLIKYVENIDSESVHGSSKIAIEISTLEEIASQVSDLVMIEKEKNLLLVSLSDISKSFLSIFSKSKKLKSQIKDVKLKIRQQGNDLKSDCKRLSSVLNEYKERCRNSLLYYIKTLDHDLRKILKPLVPTSVLNEQIKFPYINKNASLQSSIAPSLNNSSHIKPEKNNELSIEIPEKIDKPDTKTANHVELLISTLEKVAKDLISILAEANSQYYDVINCKDVYSHPQTPLAAPLPEYFVYETEESDLPDTNKIIIKEDAQS